MATKKPRITITFEPENYNLLVSLAEAQESTPTKIINNLLEELSIPLHNTLALIGAAKAAPKEVLEQYADLIGNEAARAEAYLTHSQKQVDWIAGAMSRDQSQPPYINKGVRSKTKSQQSSKRKASVVSGHFSDRGRK